MEILQWILGLGASVMLPIIMFVFAMIMGAGFTKSFRSGITIGIGFTGINLVINLLTSSLGPASIAMTERLGLNLTIIDIGWPAMSAISWAWVAAGLLIPVVLVINFIMLSLKLTKTMNVDLWNFWQFSFIGAAVTATSGSVMWGMVAASVAAVIALLLADYTQKYIENYLNNYDFLTLEYLQ